MSDDPQETASAEPPQDDAPSGDAPPGDAPSGDAPSDDAPSGDAPSGDAPSGDAPKDGASKDSGDAPSGDAPSDAALEELGDRDAIFEALWRRVLEAWDEDKPHQAILEHSLKSEKLPDLAGRYREIKERDAAKRERAQKKIDGIVLAATQMLMAMKTPPRTKTPWQWTASAAAIFAIVITYLVYAVILRGHG